MDTKKLYIKRNITKKSYSYFKENIQKYLTPKEQEKISNINDLLKYKNKYPFLKSIHKIKINKKRVDYFIKKIRSHHYDKDIIHNYTNRIYKTSKKDGDYKAYYIKNNCHRTDILNIDKLGKGFTYFEVSTYQINPSNTHLLFGVDFIGNRVYHLFIKSLYTNQIKEINIPAQPLTNIKNIFNTTTNISDFFIWINDEEIGYVSQNHYYNEGGIYIYNIVTHTKYLVKKIPHGHFGNINVTTDNQYIVVYISTYSSDSIYIMDNDYTKIKLLKTPLLPLTQYISYPLIDHDNGEWVLYEKNKRLTIIKKTTDFKNYDIYYKNDNPYETIDKLIYLDQHFIFTLKYSKGIKLIIINPCKKLTIVHDEINGYINIHNKYENINQFEYTISHYLYKPIIYKLNDTPSHYKKHYYENNIYIKPHLYFTVLSKKNPHLTKCVIIGYGSYNEVERALYYPHFIALVEEGYTIVITHLRGGGDYGFQGYSDGRLLNKQNTFKDFIDIADYIVKNKITTYNQLAIWGRSAGGLLIASVINMRPDICQLAIMGVPFVKVYDTLKSYKTPLGIESRDEFGNVTNDVMSKYIKEYDPYNNINLDLEYPNIVIYSNMYDTLVPYSQPYQYYNKIKEARIFKSGKREVNIFIDNKFGHKQGSSITNKIKTYSIIFDQLERYIS